MAVGFLRGRALMTLMDPDGQMQSFDLYSREWDMWIQFSRSNRLTSVCPGSFKFKVRIEIASLC